MTNNTSSSFWFPRTTHLCESFSEWQERCVEFVEGNEDDSWYSTLFRIEIWAHSSSSKQLNEEQQQQQQQQQQLMIASPWSRAPPRLRSEDDEDYQYNDQSNMAMNESNQEKQEDPGLIVRPVVWLVFAKSSNQYNLIHMSCAPADLAIEIDSEKISAVDLGQWHAKQVQKFIEHTPSGRLPSEIILGSDLEIAQTGEKSCSSDMDSRCAKFSLQSLKLYLPSSSSSSLVPIDLQNAFDNILDKNERSSLQNLIKSLNEERSFVTKSLQTEAFVPMNILPPDQSDPVFLSKINKQEDQRKISESLLFINSSSSNKGVSIFDLGKNCNNNNNEFRYAVSISLSAARCAEKKIQESNFHLVLHSYRAHQKQQQQQQQDDINNSIIFVRFFKDLGDAVAAGKLFDSSFYSSSSSEIVCWGDVIAPTSDCLGSLVIESWGNEEMMNHEDLMSNISTSTAMKENFLHAYVETPVDLTDNDSKSKYQRMPGELASVRLYRRALSEEEINFIIGVSSDHADGKTVMTVSEAEDLLLQRQDPPPLICSWCLRLRETNKKCGRCFCVSYCSRSHQLAHFKETHKKQCAALLKSKKELEENTSTMTESISTLKTEEIANSYSNAIAGCLSSTVDAATTFLIELSHHVVSSVDLLKSVSEHIVHKVVEQQKKTRTATVFITICCGEESNNHKKQRNQEEDFLGVVLVLASENNEKSSTRWIEKSKKLGDLWHEENSPSSKESTMIISCICRVHRFASVRNILESNIPLKPKSFFVQQQQEQPTPLFFLFNHGATGFNFFDKSASDAAFAIQECKLSTFLISDTRFSAETSTAVIRAKLDLDNINDDEKVTADNNNQRTERVSSTSKLIIVAPNLTKDKLLHPLALNGYVTRF